MFDALFAFFSSESFMPHGHCYLWRPALVWIQLLSNLAIGLAYISIAITLVVLVRRVEDIPFRLVYLAFAIFIVTCGFTHFMDAYVIWQPAYWLDGGIRIVTAVASVGTAILLPSLIPEAVALARGGRAAHRRGMKLEAMVEDLETMYEQTRELEQLKTDFFANVSHELRTPLQLIAGPTHKLLQSEELDSAQRRRVETIERNARVLLKQVDDLLDVASLEAGEYEVNYGEADVAMRLRVLAANFESLADDQGIELVVETPEHLVAEVDVDQFDIIVRNLLSNAFKFTPKQGTIRCTLAASESSEAGDDDTGRHMTLSVADSGPGVPVEDREAIFERFRQLDRGSTRRFGGTGLGLVISREFVELHHGVITVGEAPEGGALFTVELPLDAPEGARVAEAGPPAEARDADIVAEATRARRDVEQPMKEQRPGEARDRVDQSSAADRARPLVLVVEDNPDMNDYIADTLGERYRTASAFDGNQGIELALELRPEVIVSDIMMPEKSGDQLVRELGRDPRTQDIPIILLSAKADDQLRIELLKGGARDYLMKPFDDEELLARVENQMMIARTRKLLQKELKTTQRDLEELAHKLAGSRRELANTLETTRLALDKAEEASRVKSRFLGLVSHELRTPINALSLQVAVLQEDPELGGRQRALLERMNVAIERLTTLIVSLLHRASIESGQMNVEMERIDPIELGREVAEDIRPEVEKSGLELHTSFDEDVDEIVSDRRLLRLILANLMSNALKYTDTGRIDLSISREDDEYRFSVTDTGPGIPPQQRVSLFEPFERGPTARERQLPGVGLGLALVRDFSEVLGGKIELDSEVGRGSTFTLVLTPGGKEDSVTARDHE